jgi:uncharacterized protein YaaN involved in tellurite resistance
MKEYKMDKKLQERQEDIKDMANELQNSTKEVLSEVVDDLDTSSGDIISYEDASIKDQTKIEILAKEIKDDDPHSVIFFGSKAQEQINAVSDSMLEGVRNKDLGTSGDSLNSLVTAIKGFDVDSLNPNVKQGFFSKLFGFASPAIKFLGRYEDVRGQVDRITDDLESHKAQLITDVTALDRLYDVNFDYFNELELYIAAGVHKLKELDTITIPKLQEEAGESKKLAKTLGLQDIITTRNDLDRRVHDLRLTRQVAMQALPSIRMVQENDKNLISKINSTLVNTVPLWKNQLAQTITIYRSGEAAKSVKNATDLTNELLEENAKNLKQANKVIREEVERGVYDIDTIKSANNTLIEAIQESLEIAQKGKEARSKAEGELVILEDQLKGALLAASGKKS